MHDMRSASCASDCVLLYSYAMCRRNKNKLICKYFAESDFCVEFLSLSSCYVHSLVIFVYLFVFNKSAFKTNQRSNKIDQCDCKS